MQEQEQDQQHQTDPRAPPKERVTSASTQQQAKKKTASGAATAPLTSPPEKPVAKKPAPKDIAKPKDTKTAEKEAKLQRAEGQGKLATAAGASAANTERRMVVTEARAAKAASAKMQLLRHSQAVAGPSVGFVSNRTTSGHSFGSLQGYVDDWNDADTDEVTSRLALSDPRHI